MIFWHKVLRSNPTGGQRVTEPGPLRLQSEAGRSLPAALIALAVGSLLLTPFLSFVSSRSLSIRAVDETLRSQYAADAGVEFGIWTVLNSSTARSQADANPGTGFPVPFPEAVNGLTPTVTISAVPIGEWFSRQNAPTAVQQGGALEYTGGSSVYALAGDLSGSFGRYNTAGDTWINRQSTPIFWAFDGSDLVYTGGNRLYALTPAFFPWGSLGRQFSRYSIAGNSWTRMEAAPDSIGSGGCLVYTGGNHIYALRGSGSDFWRYSIPGDSWSSRANAPGGVGSGAALVYTGGNFIYAFRGGYSNNFWRYNISSNSWTTLSSAPGGVGPGGSLAYNGGDYIYALQGGTSAFWRYTISLNSWGVLADSLNPVSSGGDLVFVDADSGYTLRGGGTSDYWEFLITPPRYDVNSQTGKVDISARMEIDGASRSILFWDID